MQQALDLRLVLLRRVGVEWLEHTLDAHPEQRKQLSIDLATAVGVVVVVVVVAAVAGGGGGCSNRKRNHLLGVKLADGRHSWWFSCQR